MRVEEITMLVTAKTYPTISNRYNETVCTAGITQNGSLVRLYPICYRSLSKQERFKKYQWISFQAIRDLRDPRQESYKLISNIIPSDFIATKQRWASRRSIVLSNVQLDLRNIIKSAYNQNEWKSLFVFKPSNIIKFNVVDYSAVEKINKKREMLLHRVDSYESLVENIQYKFSYTFVDSVGAVTTLQIIDWEIYQLARKLIILHKNNFPIILKILTNKYYDEIAYKRDVYFFLGTNKYWHIRKSKNPFMIIGVFYPPKLEDNGL